MPLQKRPHSVPYPFHQGRMQDLQDVNRGSHRTQARQHPGLPGSGTVRNGHRLFVSHPAYSVSVTAAPDSLRHSTWSRPACVGMSSQHLCLLCELIKALWCSKLVGALFLFILWRRKWSHRKDEPFYRNVTTSIPQVTITV